MERKIAAGCDRCPFLLRTTSGAKLGWAGRNTLGSTMPLVRLEVLQHGCAGSRPRPLFLKFSVAVLLGLGACVFFSYPWPNATIAKAVWVVEGLVVLCWLYSYVRDKKPKTQAQEDWESNLSWWYCLAPTVFMVMLGAIISAGPVVLLPALGGIGIAFLIRRMGRR